MSVSAGTDVGQARDHNEDQYLVADLTSGITTRAEDEEAYTIGPKGSLLLVADGMGGALAGEVASQMATEIILDRLTATWSRDPEARPERFATSVREAVEEANARIHAQASENLDLQGMGTTATIVGVLGSHFLLSQVGDSRAYRIRDGRIRQLTRDQSFVQHLVDTGRMTAEEALQLPQKNVILQALGPGPTVDVVQSWEPIARGDTVLLCSDGLSEMVSPEEIAEIVDGTSSLARACRRLVEEANANGGKDNITVVVARMSGSELRPAEDLEAAGGRP